ncbi:hypothetical protein DQ384_14480 [Sphaerisporangium album]|uniref:Uncharacterized protein n=1 Tax=Sphaerisporangium album TaxID=509200 RepID=A0A367FJP1_9ACTN|nr:hypothetical protein [Sphaerisporangium album]RCG30514.1 hypothetical protein DQ384_14480 [Sphaerisporangium album]
MRRNVFAALVLSGAFVLPAAATAAQASVPSDDLVNGGYESLTACQSAIPEIQQQGYSAQTLVCKAYSSTSAETPGQIWGVYRTGSLSEKTAGEMTTSEIPSE